MLAAVIFSLCTRIRIGSGGQVERNSVLASVRCSLKHTIEEGNIEWMDSQVHADRLSRSLDPLGRRAETGSRFLWAPKCELKPTLDNVLGYLFLTFIVFPSSPFICVILCIFAGFVGYGMVGIRRIRNNLNPFILDTDSESDDECENSSSKRNLCNDIEMTTLSGEIINQTPKTDAVTASVHSSASLKNTSTADLASDSLQALSGSAVANSSSSRVRRLDVARRARAHRLSMRFGSAPSFLSAEAARQAVLDENSASMSSVQTSSYSAQCPMSDGTFNMPSASQNQMLAVESSSIISAYERGLMQAEILNQQAQWQQSCAAQLSEMTNAMGQACQELKKLFNLISSNVDDQLSSTSVFNGEPISFEGTSSLKPTLSADGSMNNASVEPAEKASRVLRKSDIPAKSVTEEDVFKGAELKERNNGLEEARITGTVEDTVLTNSGDHLTEISSSNTGVSVDSNTFCSDEEDSEEEKACQRLLDKKEEPYDDAGSNEHNFFEIAAEYQSDSDGQSDEEHNEISGTSIPRRTVATETDQDSQISEHIRMQSENSFRNSTELSPSTSGVVVRPGLMRDVSSRPVHAQHSHQSDHRFSGLNELNVQPPHNIILTPEQRIRLNQYRQQLSVRDLLNYSEFMRRLAYRQAQMEGIRIGIQPISNERAPFIPEEDEEEVADPSSSTSDLAAGFIRAAEFSNKGPKKKDREE
ncbi:hypothetical protein AB6A40_001778 [Gnathostoma spinigerum]|uniref:Uncharacterized protein n=1 Tax=Gnathostoma spinigerum TaxID=75299 RepID=A0ABD6EAA9_9BILA